MIAKIYFLLNLFVLVAALIQGPQAWKRRRRPVAKPLVLWCFFLALISSTHIIYFLVDYKFDALLIEHITICLGFFVQIIWIWSLTEFTLDRVTNKWAFLLIEAVIMTIVIITNSSHELFYDTFSISTINGLPNVVMNFGPLRKIHALLVMILWNGFIIWAIIQHHRKPKVPSRAFYTLILLVIVSQVQLWLYTMGITPFKFSVVINACIMLAATYYYRVLDIIPFARKKIVENMNAGIAIVNKDNEIIDRNALFENMIGMSVPLTEPFKTIQSLPDRFQAILRNEELIQSKGIVENLAKRQLEYSIIPIEGKNNETGKSLILRDVTEEVNLKKQKEYYTQQLEESKTALERLDEMKSNFFSNVTHEFRTPLTLIQEPARSLISYPDPKVSFNAKLIKSNSNRLLELVNQLLTLTSMDSGKLDLNMTIGNLPELLREEFQKFLPKAAKENLQLHLSIEPQFPLLSFDKQKIQSIIANLISNAIKYSDEGKIQIRLSTLQTNEGSPHFQLQIEDAGRGISQETLPYIFDRFYQEDGSDTRMGEGTGIGLALVQELVHLMDGSITARSELGVGSIFTVQLPLITGKAIHDDLTAQNAQLESVSDTLEDPEGLEAPSAGMNKDLKVALVVEDNEELRSFMRRSMQSKFSIVEASNGAEGVEKAKELLPDVIISDVMMPEKDGVALLREIKSNALTNHIPVILLTAKNTIEDRLAGLRQGADDYISKPFQLEELILRTQNVVANRILATEKYLKALPFPPNISSIQEDEENEFIREFMLIIESELDNDTMSIDDYAARMNISRSHLHRKIKSMTELSTTHFIRDYRLQRAMSMLKNKEGSVREISMKVGISNPKYFSSVFKMKFGLSPSEV